MEKTGKSWWVMRDLNPRHLRCERMALVPTYRNPPKNTLSIQAKFQARPSKSGSSGFSEPERTSSQDAPRKMDGMDGAFSPLSDALLAVITWPLVGVTIAFLGLLRAAEWALKPRLIYATIGSVLVLSLAVIWAVSRANGM